MKTLFWSVAVLGAVLLLVGVVGMVSATTLTFDAGIPTGVTVGGDMTWNDTGGGHLYCEAWDTDDDIHFSSETYVNSFQMNAMPWEGYIGGDVGRIDIAAFDSAHNLVWSETVDLTGYEDWNHWLTVSVETNNISRLIFSAPGGPPHYNGFWPSIDNLVINEGYNHPPVADANGPYVVPATSWDGAWVTLDGTASCDPDEDLLSYRWQIGDRDIGSEPVLDYQFPIDITEVSLTVTDSCGESDTDKTTVTVTLMDVAIDIKPGSEHNSINLGSHGVIPVAFLTTTAFDASTINPDTVTLAGEDFSGLVQRCGKKQETMSSLEDVDGDDDLDLVVHLSTENLSLDPGAVVCVLGALTFDGYVVQGEDAVNIVPGD